MRILLICSIGLIVLINQNCSQPSFEASQDRADTKNQRQPQVIVTDQDGNNDTDDDSEDPSGTLPNNGPMRPVVAAVGHMGRVLLSCDGGTTWIKNQSIDDENRCWESIGNSTEIECDHNNRPGTAINFYKGWLYTAHGWGEQGPIRRTQSGTQWQTLIDETSMQGLHVIGDWIISGSRRVAISSDGVNFTTPDQTTIEGYNVRSGDVVIQENTTALAFVADIRSDGLRDFSVSLDLGVSWDLRGAPSECPNKLYTGHGNILLYNNSSDVYCFSSDLGLNWELLNSPGPMAMVFDGTQFLGINGNTRYLSAVGRTWVTNENITYLNQPSTPSATIRNTSLLAYQPELNRYTAISQGWGNFYEKQYFYYSSDGLTWHQSLSPNQANGNGGHPIRMLKSGLMFASACD